MNTHLKIAWLSDFDFKSSGYFNISTALCSELANAGHEVKAVGLGYKGQEHNFPFGIIPTDNMREANAILQNMRNMWQFDVLIVAFDIPLQERVVESIKNRDYPYVGIFPLEATPLTFSWAVELMKMDKRLVISEFGKGAIEQASVPVTFLPVGIDLNSWKKPERGERKKIRESLFGLDDDTFVVLTVADNQERKNLTAGMDAFRRFSQDNPKSVYWLVTRENNPVGWKLMDYAQEIGIADKLMIFERGMSFQQLWSTYVAADVFVLPSKSEGLGLPLREAMAVGLPCIATDCSGMREQLADGRGILIPAEYVHRDPFGNGERHWINRELLAQALQTVKDNSQHEMIERASEYVKEFTWKRALEVLEKEISEYGKA